MGKGHSEPGVNLTAPSKFTERKIEALRGTLSRTTLLTNMVKVLDLGQKVAMPLYIDRETKAPQKN